MPRFLFKGFDLGSPVAIAAAQNGLSDSASVPTWGQADGPGPGAGTGNLSIAKISANRVTAPAGVWFGVDLNSLSGFVGEDGNPITGPSGGTEYDPRYHEVTYIWDFDDPGTFGTPLNMPTVWNNKNVAYGPRVAHAFSAPGEYTVSVWAIDTAGNTGMASTTVTVVNADTVYTGNRTIYFDPTNNHPDSPSGATQVTSVNALQSAINNLSQTGRVLIAKGITQNNFDLDLNGRSIEYIGTRGTGSRPVLTISNTNSNWGLNWGGTAGVGQITITGLSQRGHWDSTVQGGGSPFPQGDTQPFSFRQLSNNVHAVVYDCDFSGFARLDPSGDREFVSTTMVVDCSITNWEDYGMFVPRVDGASAYGRFATVGCSIFQDVDALGGDNGKDSRDNEHGPTRIERMHEVYLGCNDYFSRNGWAPANGNTTPQAQPCVRMNTNPITAMYNLDRCIGENGAEATFVANPANAGFTAVPGNWLYDKVAVVQTAQSRTACFEHSFGGVTMRNLLGIMPNVPSEYNENFREAHDFIKLEPEVSTAANYTEPVRIHNSTYLNLRNSANDSGHAAAFTRIVANFSNVTEENNIIHAPWMDTPRTAAAPISLGTPIAGFTPRFKGLKFTGQNAFQSQFANPSSLPQPIPQTGSNALNGTGAGLLAYDDILMATRGDPETLGAFET